MLEIKNTVTEVQNVFDRLISRLYMAKERISEIEDIIKSSKTKRAKRAKDGKKKKKQNRIFKDLGQLKKM